MGLCRNAYTLPSLTKEGSKPTSLIRTSSPWLCLYRWLYSEAFYRLDFSEYSIVSPIGTFLTAEKASSDLCRNTSESTAGFWGGDDYGLES